MKKISLFLACMLTLPLYYRAQQNYRQSNPPQQQSSSWGCGTNMALKNNLAADPSINVLSPAGGQNRASSIASPASPYIIPIVFHIISDPNNPTPVPTYAQVQMQLASLNAAFSNNLASLNNNGTGPRAVNAQIQFCFAKEQQVNGLPAAWPTSSVGVVYYSVTNSITTNVNINSNTSMATLAALTNANFPPGKYLNIWCVPNICTSSLTAINAPPSVIGMGTFPWMTAPIDGIVMRSDVIGNNIYANFNTTMFAPLDEGKILAHEAGHYLGLFHTFETITSGNLATAGGLSGCYGTTNPATEGDLIFDTPPTQINGQTPPGTYNTCNETYAPYGAAADENDQLENFMSYSDDDYMSTFTANQASRMWGALDASYPTSFLSGQRSNLCTQTNLNNTGVNTAPSCGPGLLTSAFNASLVSSSISCSTTAFQFSQPILSGYLSSASYTWQFGDGSTGNSPNPLHVYNNTPGNYTATLTVSNGTAVSSSTLTVHAQTGTPQIAGFSGDGHPVCRGTEQVIYIRFPANVSTAMLTDGTNYYPVTSNLIHNSTVAGAYQYPFMLNITNSATYSLVSACGNTYGPAVSFTVVDCCSNLVTNGDLESGPVGFYSQYTLNPTYTYNGYGAINFPALTTYPAFTSEQNISGKFLIVDSYPGYSGCHIPGASRLLLGQAISGLKPSTKYYVSVKISEGDDSITTTSCADKFHLLFANSTSTLLTKNMITRSLPTNVVTWLSGVTMDVLSFTVTTPSNVTAASVFSLELFEIEDSNGYGFDYAIDNLIVEEMNPAIIVSPLTTTVSCPSSAQLTVTGNCDNISNYTLLWQPSSGLSCSNCPNPIASPLATTVYTLIAIPAISNPPQPNLVFTNTVYVNNPITVAVANPTPLCLSATYTLVASGVPSVTWQPSGLTGTTQTVTPPNMPTTYTASYLNPAGCLYHSLTTILPPPAYSFLLSGTSLYCTGTSPAIVTATPYPAGASATFSWLPGNLTGASQALTPSVSTTYTVMATVNGCPVSNNLFHINTQSVSLTVSGNTVFCLNIAPASITVTPYPMFQTTYTWQPGNLSGPSHSLSPSVTTVYTVMATIGDCPAISEIFTIQKVIYCTGIEEFEEKDAGIDLFPNPSNGVIYLTGKLSSETLKIKVTDNLGREIYKSDVMLTDYKATLDLKAEEGIYFIEMITSENKRSVKNIIIKK